MDNIFKERSPQVIIRERDPDINTYPDDKPAGAISRVQRRRWLIWWNWKASKLWLRKSHRDNDWVLFQPWVRNKLKQQFTATASQTAFTLTAVVPISNLDMYRNGILLPDTCYTVLSNNVTYIPAQNGGQNLLAGDRIQFRER